MISWRCVLRSDETESNKEYVPVKELHKEPCPSVALLQEIYRS